MAGGDLFRKEAFDKVSSPEELDQIMVVTSWRSWILLSTTVFLLGSAIAYGFLGRIPDLVPGQGMILEGGHIIPVQSDIRGTVSEIHVKVGDDVKEGDLLVSVLRPDLQDDLDDLRLQLNLLRMEKETLLKFETEQLTRQRTDNANQVKEEEEVIKMAELILKQREKALKDQIELYDQGLVTRPDLINAENAVAGAKSQLVGYHEKITSLKKNLFDLNIEMQQRHLTREENLIKLQSRVHKAENLLERGKNIHSPFNGRIIETEISIGFHANSGTVYFKLLETGDEDLGFKGIFFVDKGKAKKLKKEMKVQVFPGEIDRNKYGFLIGRVKSVSNFPVSEQTLTNQFGDAAIARQMISSMGMPYEVDVTLIPNKGTHSGFEWSSKKGPPVLLQSGTICESKYEVGYKRPISLVMGWVRNLLGEAGDN